MQFFHKGTVRASYVLTFRYSSFRLVAPAFQSIGISVARVLTATGYSSNVDSDEDSKEEVLARLSTVH